MINWQTYCHVVCYTNSAVNDLRKAGIKNVLKLEPENVEKFVSWMDSGLREIIVVKRSSEKDLLTDYPKKKLHLVIEYNNYHFPDNRIEELQDEIKHREHNYLKNLRKKEEREKVWDDDPEIIEEEQ